MTAGQEMSIDENLKCGICLNLCDRPITVSPHRPWLWCGPGVLSYCGSLRASPACLL